MSAAHAMPAPLVQPALVCTSSTIPPALAVLLKGWLEGQCTTGEWLDTGGPIDATDRLPMGGAWSRQHLQAHVLGGSVLRGGGVA